MAIYYLAVQVIGRSAGRSAVAAAAYRAGERIHDERTGLTHDYTRRRGEIETTILAPEGSPEWVYDRSSLWNAVEAAEKRKDSQVAKEIVVALPKELGAARQRALVLTYVEEEFVSKGMVADVAIHHMDANNPHAHVMLTTRVMTPEGFGAKIRHSKEEWQNRGQREMEEWRVRWAQHANRALERAGELERIDHRSYERQGVDRVPQVHFGPDAAALEKRGVRTQVGDQNRDAAELNRVIIELARAREQLRDLQREMQVKSRRTDRIQSGWSIGAADALVKLEQEHGHQLKAMDLEPIRVKAYEQLSQTQKQIKAIEKEGERLKNAAIALGQRAQYADVIKRLDAPVLKVKRLFNRELKQEYGQAKQQVRVLNDRLRELGVTDEKGLAEQRIKWETESNVVLPKLRAEEQGRARNVARVDLVMDGFRRERLRDLQMERQITLGRDRDRHIDRSR